MLVIGRKGREARSTSTVQIYDQHVCLTHGLLPACLPGWLSWFRSAASEPEEEKETVRGWWVVREESVIWRSNGTTMVVRGQSVV